MPLRGAFRSSASENITMHSQTLSCITHTIDAPGPQDPLGALQSLWDLGGAYEVLGLRSWYLKTEEIVIPIDMFDCLCRNRKTGRLCFAQPQDLGKQGRNKALLASYSLTHITEDHMATRIAQAVEAPDEKWSYWLSRITLPDAFAYFHLRSPYAHPDDVFHDLRLCEDGRLFDGALLIPRGESNHEKLFAEDRASSIVDLLAEFAEIGLFWDAEFDMKHSRKIAKRGNPLKGIVL